MSQLLRLRFVYVQTYYFLRVDQCCNQCGNGQSSSFSLAIRHSCASPCGSTIKKNTIKPPTMMNSICAAMSVGQPRPPTIIFFNSTGINTKKAAPAKLPKIEPNPPMMIMNITRKDWLMPKTSPTSTAPRYTEKKSAPDTPM